MGDDWKGKFNFLNKYCQIKYLSRTPKVSSSLLKEIIE